MNPNIFMMTCLYRIEYYSRHTLQSVSGTVPGPSEKANPVPLEEADSIPKFNV